MSPFRLLAAAVVAAPLFALSAPAHAASSYDGCTGFINSVPTTIVQQGVWCFNKDLATSISSGNAITINQSNVTIDCNGFKLGGLSAGAATATTGIRAEDRVNITVRDCNIRGFAGGVLLGGEFAGGHRVEDNRFEYNTVAGMVVFGPGSVIRGNTVVDTGGTTFPILPAYIAAIAVYGRTDVIDNQVSGVDGSASDDGVGVGVLVGSPDGSAIARNRIGGIYYAEGGEGFGIAMMDIGPLDIRENTIAGGMPGFSVACAPGGQFLHGNALMMGEPTGLCEDGGDNYGFDFDPEPP